MQHCLNVAMNIQQGLGFCSFWVQIYNIKKWPRKSSYDPCKLFTISVRQNFLTTFFHLSKRSSCIPRGLYVSIFSDYHYLFDHCALEISRTELASGGSQDQQLADRNDKGNHTKYEHWYQGPSSLLRVAFQTHVSKQGDFFMDLVILPFPFPFFFSG